MVATRQSVARQPGELLTPWEKHVLVKCYSEGHTAAQVAAWYNVSRPAIADTIRRASDKLEAAGFPRPRPHGRGCRDELRAALPCVTRRVG